MAIIGISGKIGSGKDTVGMIIQTHMAKQSWPDLQVKKVLEYPKEYGAAISAISTYKIKKFAGKLKQVASMLTRIPIENFENQEFKETSLGPEWGMTVRDLLQKLGTEGLRVGLHENTWVNALMADYQPLDYDQLTESEIYSNWIITDTRFINEAEAIKNREGIIIRIENKKNKSSQSHSSETALDDWEFDYVIDNSGTIEELSNKVFKMLLHFKLINPPAAND